MEDIGIIILNYNSSDFTINCINSIIKLSNSEITYKIVIVDNNSSIGEFEKLKQIDQSDNIIIFRNRKNSGFGGGHMAGINFCSPKYYFFLNNDTLLINDNLKILYRFMEDNPMAGICSGQMYNAKKILTVNFNYIPDLKLKLLGSGILRIFNKIDYPKKGKEYSDPLRVPVLNGSSLFIRSGAFKSIGGFDPTYFLYCEEEDIAIRMKNYGFYSYLVPEAKFIHLQGKSTPGSEKVNFMYLKEFYISQHYLYLKHFGIIPALIWRLTQFFRSLRKFYKDSGYVKLAFLILINPSLKKSLRYHEKNRAVG